MLFFDEIKGNLTIRSNRNKNNKKNTQRNWVFFFMY
ncbi:hypothetical protein PI23P_07085 [Polaribacter irgensii 23-P]|uniref:Uncharacterized protein n=1 Tax=Polaribacter irgensii 23-P TaxID=313594 RepID=A4BYX6_9FLAO|nr:hypothetical protein PI23P_07085 [Polaribacter irgensii 23-P]